MALRVRTDWNHTRFHGVNLGNWLVLERWMESSRMPGPFTGTSADDERGLRKELEPQELAARLDAHRTNYVTRDTFLWLKDAGCNLVRLPIPYHLFGDAAHEPCIGFVDNAMQWAEEAGIPMLLDLHTVPGGQNGFDNSGTSGLCTWHLTSGQIHQTLDVLELIAQRYAGHPALFGLEPMNEPASPRVFATSMKRYGAEHPGRVERSAPIPHAVLKQFYRLVYQRIRPILGQRVALVLHDQFMLGAWAGFMPAQQYPNVWIDTHQYVATFTKAAHIRTLRGHLAIARGIGARISLAERYHPVLVGEWSLSQHIHAMRGASAPQKQRIMHAYAQAQLAAYDRGHGSCFWSLRNGTYADWSFETSVKRKWLDLGGRR